MNNPNDTVTGSRRWIYALSIFLLAWINQCSDSPSSALSSTEYQSINASYHSRLIQIRSGREHDRLMRDRRQKLQKLLQKLEKAPVSDQNEFIQAKIRYDLGQSDQSLAIFDEIIRKNSPLTLKAKLEKVRIKLANKESEEAVSIFKSIENKYRPDKYYYDVIYQLSLHSEKSEDQWIYSYKYLKAARKIAYLRPRTGQIHVNLAAIEKKRSGPEKAIALLKNVLRQPLNTVAERTIRCYLEPLKRINAPVPHMDIKTWLHSDPIEINDLKGKTTLICFWSPGCRHCHQLLPKLQKLFLRYRESDFLLLGITRLTGRYRDGQNNIKSVSRPEEIRLIKNLLAGYRATFPIALVERKNILNDFGVLGYPTIFLINRAGQIWDFYLGTDDFDALAGKVHELISTKTAIE
jgi:thioredoxin-like negative regulator of GroEL